MFMQMSVMSLFWGGGFLGGIVTYLDSLTCLIFGFDSQL